MIGTRVSLRLRMSARDVSCTSELVDGSRLLGLFSDLAAELLIRLDGDEGVFQSYDSVEFLAPVYAGDYVEASAELLSVDATERRVRFEATKVIANARQVGLPASAASVLRDPVVVCRALGACMTPRELQRKPRELYVPQLPPGEPPTPDAVVTPTESAAERTLSSGLTHSAEVVLGAILRVDNRSPSALADEARRCRDAGAALLQLEIGGVDDGVWRECVSSIRRATDCVLQLSSHHGTRRDLLSDRTRAMAGADLVTLTCGSVNFDSDVLVMSRPQLREIVHLHREAKDALALECFEIGHVETALAIGPPASHVDLVIGAPGAMTASERNLRDLVDRLRLAASRPTFSVTVLDSIDAEDDLLALTLRLGGHPRIGGRHLLVSSTAATIDEALETRITKAATYARSLGRVPVDPETARRVLGLGPGAAR